MAAANSSLQVNRELLEPSFESYRLSLDPIPTYTVELEHAVEELQLKEPRYTLEHMRAFAMFNYLQLDPWYRDSVLFVDGGGRVQSLSVTLDAALGKPKEVYSFEWESGRRDDRLCPSLSLTSATWAALSDGGGRLLLLRTGRRGDGAVGRWEVLFSEQQGEPFTILHSSAHVQDGVHAVELLLLRVQKDPLETAGSGYAVFLEWLTVGGASQHGEDRKYEVRRRRVLRGKAVPQYAAVEPGGRGLMVASETPFVFTRVDGRPVEPPAPEPEEAELPEPLYSWRQTEADVSVTLRLPEGVAGRDVSVVVTRDELRVGAGLRPPLLEGRLFAAVDAAAGAWSVGDANRLELRLQKLDEGPMWAELVLGDRRGKLLLSDQQAALMRRRLELLTSDGAGGGAEPERPPCDTQELEDCDAFPEDGFSLTRFDGETLLPTQVVNLGGHQYLFSVDVDPTLMPCLCLRHDVDALVWQPRPERPAHLWEHVATFNALGYVQASKRDRKFATCAPDFSFAALGECLRRAFIYRQPSPVETVLYNRKQGRQVGTVAKQQVASLDCDRPILGFRASNQRLFILTAAKLFVLKVNSD